MDFEKKSELGRFKVTQSEEEIEKKKNRKDLKKKIQNIL